MSIESGVPLFRVDSIRPNIERDKLAWYMFPGVRTLAAPAIELLKNGITEGLFTDVETEVHEVPMYLAGHGEVMLGDGKNRPRVVAIDNDADLLIVTALLDTTPAFTQEYPYDNVFYGAMKTLAGGFTKEQENLTSHLLKHGRSERTAKRQAARRLHISTNQFNTGLILKQDGTLKDVIGRIGYAFLDWQVDLCLEEGDQDEYSPTIRNTRDVARLSMVEFRTALISEDRTTR